MALITCLECGKNFSDRAMACPECGCPTSEIVEQSISTNNGQLLIANNAFQDARYDEAYQMFTQLYAQYQTNLQILVRLGLSTAAKDCFNDGIPSSTKDLISKAFATAKGTTSSHEALIDAITPLVEDVDKVIKDMNYVLAKRTMDAYDQITPTRSVGSMAADVFFGPADAAHRNLYEDRKALESNAKLLSQTLANKEFTSRKLDELKGEILQLVANTLSQPLNETTPLYQTLRTFVVTSDHAKCFETISGKKMFQENIYVLCHGEEKILLHFDDVYCCLMKNGHIQNRGGFKPPKGTVTVTNYKITYTAQSLNHCFTKTLEDLKDICAGGIYIKFLFSDGAEVHFRPNPDGPQNERVANLKKIFII